MRYPRTIPPFLGAALIACLPAVTARAQPAPECCQPSLAAERSWPGGSGTLMNLPGVLADEIGGVYAVLPNYLGEPGIYLSVSRDHGDTWDDPFRIGDLGAGALPSGIGPDGQILFLVRDFGRIVRTFSPDQGRTFVGPEVVWDPEGFVGGLSAALDPTGPAYGAWLAGNNPNDPPGIYVMTSRDFGLTWDLPARVPGTGDIEQMPFLRILARDGRVSLVWLAEQADGFHIRTSTSDDDGRTWSPASVADTTPGDTTLRPFGVHAGLGSDNHLTVLYTPASSTAPASELEVRVRTSADGGRSWGDPEVVLGRSPSSAETGLVTTRSGRAHAFWRSASDDEPRFQTSTNNGRPGSWMAEPGRPAARGRDVHHFRAVVDHEAVPWFVHDDYRDDRASCDPPTRCESVYIDRSCDGGTGWLSQEIRLDSDDGLLGTHSEDPEISATADGRLHVIWTDFRGRVGDLPDHHYLRIDLVPEGAPGLLVEPTGAGSPCEPRGFRLRADLDDVACQNPSFRWFRDGEEIAGASGAELILDPRFGPVSHLYQYEVLCDPDTTCGAISARRTVAFPPPEAGTLTLNAAETPPTFCRPSVHRFEAVADPGTCANPRYRWLLDGEEVAGATGPDLDVPAGLREGGHEVRVEVSCADPACEPEPVATTFTVRPPEGEAPAGSLEGRLFVLRERSGELRLRWTDAGSEAMGYHVLSGTLGAWYSHRPRRCAVEREPVDAPSTTSPVPRPDGDAYFLVAPANCHGEGAVCTDSEGVPRPLSPVAPSCGPLP